MAVGTYMNVVRSTVLVFTWRLEALIDSSSEATTRPRLCSIDQTSRAHMHDGVARGGVSVARFLGCIITAPAAPIRLGRSTSSVWGAGSRSWLLVAARLFAPAASGPPSRG